MLVSVGLYLAVIRRTGLLCACFVVVMQVLCILESSHCKPAAVIIIFTIIVIIIIIIIIYLMCVAAVLIFHRLC